MSSNVLTMPATETTWIQGLPAPTSSQPAPARRILLVDDEESIRQLGVETLNPSGYRVDTAADGETGWEMLCATDHGLGRYDLLITDNNMPRLSGFELIKRVRLARMVLPVIMASGMAPTAPINVEWLQLSAVLPKPFYPSQLLQAVRAVLNEV
jgi:DNA-binding response OmpR family regulator